MEFIVETVKVLYYYFFFALLAFDLVELQLGNKAKAKQNESMVHFEYLIIRGWSTLYIG